MSKGPSGGFYSVTSAVQEEEYWLHYTGTSSSGYTFINKMLSLKYDKKGLKLKSKWRCYIKRSVRSKMIFKILLLALPSSTSIYFFCFFYKSMLWTSSVQSCAGLDDIGYHSTQKTSDISWRKKIYCGGWCRIGEYCRQRCIFILF